MIIKASMKKISILLLVTLLFASCNRLGLGGGDRGHVVGVQNRDFRPYPDPPGMVYVPAGSFIMGAADQDIAFGMGVRTRVVSIPPFYMDDTEITNNQYRQFVHWVRDSIALDMLKDIYPEDYAIEEDADGMFLDEPMINWNARRDRSGEFRFWTAEDEREIISTMFLPDDRRFYRRNVIDTRQLVYRYFTSDLREAARVNHIDRRDMNINDLIRQHEVHVYPDTLVWISDYTYSYNEPMARQYFWHPAFDDYPVVGVSWSQAEAFNHWRTQYLNSHMARDGRPGVMEFRLPSEAEWEYAARGGRELSPYPWGGPYLRDENGCFLANFKPMRGDYTSAGTVYTSQVGLYPPNDFGLYDMAGNVAEWTRTAFNESSDFFTHDMSPDFQHDFDPATDPPHMSRKVVRGGSFKDIGHFLRVDVRSHEYQDTTRSYVGFRSVQSYLGPTRN